MVFFSHFYCNIKILRLPDETDDPKAYANKLFGSQISRGINFANYENIPVEITEGSADPVKCLDEADFDPTIIPNLKRMGIDSLTPIQQYSIPVLMDYQDF